MSVCDIYCNFFQSSLVSPGKLVWPAESSVVSRQRRRRTGDSCCSCSIWAHCILPPLIRQQLKGTDFEKIVPNIFVPAHTEAYAILLLFTSIHYFHWLIGFFFLFALFVGFFSRSEWLLLSPWFSVTIQIVLRAVLTLSLKDIKFSVLQSFLGCCSRGPALQNFSSRHSLIYCTPYSSETCFLITFLYLFQTEFWERCVIVFFQRSICWRGKCRLSFGKWRFPYKHLQYSMYGRRW